MFVRRFSRIAMLAGLAVLMEQAPGGDGSSGGGGGSHTPPTGAQPGAGQTFSAEYVRELRAEAKDWREKFQASEAKVKELSATADQAGKDADAKVKAADKAASDRILQAELKAHALKAGLVDLDGLKLADLSKVKLNDKGEVEGADDLFKGLKESKPYLFGQSGNTSTPNNPPGSTPPGAINARDIKDPAQYAASKAQFLAQHGG